MGVSKIKEWSLSVANGVFFMYFKAREIILGLREEHWRGAGMGKFTYVGHISERQTLVFSILWSSYFSRQYVEPLCLKQSSKKYRRNVHHWIR